MLVNRLLSIVALVSAVAPILATPLPRSDGHETELDLLGTDFEVEKNENGSIKGIETENEKLGREVEVEIGKGQAEIETSS